MVVVPRHFDQRQGSCHRARRNLPWIRRAAARVETRRPADGILAGPDEPLLPESVTLPALGEVWRVEYRFPPRRGATARETAGGTLLVTGPPGDAEASRQALIRWLRRRAQTGLAARLEEVASAHGLPFRVVTVRHQRTRWGSCSPQRAISLNLRLLFLDPAIVDHVLLHELCHTRELNHSKRFWALLEAHDPDWRVHRRQAREVWRTLPRWLGAGNGGLDL